MQATVGVGSWRHARDFFAKSGRGTALAVRKGERFLATMHPSSIAHFERMLQEDPANPVFHYMMGNELRKLALLDQAVDAFRRALHLKIDHLGVYLVLSETLEALGRFEEAIEALETGIEEAKRRDYELAQLHLRGCLDQLRMRRG